VSVARTTTPRTAPWATDPGVARKRAARSPASQQGRPHEPIRGMRRARAALGLVAAGLIGLTAWLGLEVTPPDAVQGNLVRLLYVHPAVAWVALYVAFGIAVGASLLWLWPRTRHERFDRAAHAAMEVGTVYTALTLVTGSLWGRPTWGVWWVWDARLTSTALLFVMQLGYLAVRRVPGDADAVARRSAIAALAAALDVPIVHFSVDWWRTLHQGATVLNADLSPKVHGSMAWTLLLSFVAFTALFFWMLSMRVEQLGLEAREARDELARRLEERRREGAIVADSEPPLVGARLGAPDEED
jgi:heme exporter protein C